MDQIEVRSLLPLYVGGDLSPEDHLAVWRALAADPDLAAECRRYERAYTALRALSFPQVPPRYLEGFAESVRRNIGDGAPGDALVDPPAPSAAEEMNERLRALISIAAGGDATPREQAMVDAAVKSSADLALEQRGYHAALDALALAGRPEIPAQVRRAFAADVRARIAAASSLAAPGEPRQKSAPAHAAPPPGWAARLGRKASRAVRSPLARLAAAAALVMVGLGIGLQGWWPGRAPTPAADNGQPPAVSAPAPGPEVRVAPRGSGVSGDGGALVNTGDPRSRGINPAAGHSVPSEPRVAVSLSPSAPVMP
ncbi:MAG: hypothetical protein HY719_11815, partial [Planctomycetes bacterium]|nr:hypothetical protein [Planctomycetota bacterium]